MAKLRNNGDADFDINWLHGLEPKSRTTKVRTFYEKDLIQNLCNRGFVNRDCATPFNIVLLLAKASGVL